MVGCTVAVLARFGFVCDAVICVLPCPVLFTEVVDGHAGTILHQCQGVSLR